MTDGMSRAGYYDPSTVYITRVRAANTVILFLLAFRSDYYVWRVLLGFEYFRGSVLHRAEPQDRPSPQVLR